jgi:hemerythrin-like domain-containing protein
MMFTLVDVLQREHASLRELLNLMQEQVAGETLPDYGLLREILLYCESYPGAYHHPKEDLIYAALCKHAPKAAEAVEDLEAEHVIMASATREILGLVSRAAAGDISAEENLPQKIDAYARFYRTHMKREERDFFPKALEALAPEHWLEMETHVINPTDPFFSEKSAALMRAFLDRASK